MVHNQHGDDLVRNLVVIVEALDVRLDEARHDGLEDAPHDENEELDHQLLSEEHDRNAQDNPSLEVVSEVPCQAILFGVRAHRGV